MERTYRTLDLDYHIAVFLQLLPSVWETDLDTLSERYTSEESESKKGLHYVGYEKNEQEDEK